jgi:predicted metal-binding membrane protein
MNPAWMLELGALMGAERATTRGRRPTGPLGPSLMVWAVLRAGGSGLR